MVAAAILVATFRATPRNCFNHEGHEGEENQAIGHWLLAFGFWLKTKIKPDDRELLLRCYNPHEWPVRAPRRRTLADKTPRGWACLWVRSVSGFSKVL